MAPKFHGGRGGGSVVGGQEHLTAEVVLKLGAEGYVGVLWSGKGGLCWGASAIAPLFLADGAACAPPGPGGLGDLWSKSGESYQQFQPRDPRPSPTICSNK